MISCLTITQPGHESYLRESIQDYWRQSYTNSELVILHSGDESFESKLATIIKEFNDSRIRQYHLTEDAKTCADMFDAALGEWICFWSDTGRHYSKRLEQQLEFCQKQKVDVSYFGERLHLFVPSNELFWEDWANSDYAQSRISNTMMGRREALLKSASHCDVAELPEALNKTGITIGTFSGQGYLCLERYTGLDESAFQQHGQIAAQTRLEFDGLQLRLPMLLEAFEDLQLSCERFKLPCSRSQIAFAKEGDGWVFAELGYQ